MKVLALLLRENSVVAGAACTEIHLSHYLRLCADKLSITYDDEKYLLPSHKLRNYLKMALNHFADCLERTALAIEDSLPQFEVMESILQANQHSLHYQKSMLHSDSASAQSRKAVKLFGWNPVEKKPFVVLDRTCGNPRVTVVDVLYAKLQALHIAVDTVNSIINMDDIISQ